MWGRPRAPRACGSAWAIIGWPIRTGWAAGLLHAAFVGLALDEAGSGLEDTARLRAGQLDQRRVVAHERLVRIHHDGFHRANGIPPPRAEATPAAGAEAARSALRSGVLRGFGLDGVLGLPVLEHLTPEPAVHFTHNFPIKATA